MDDATRMLEAYRARTVPDAATRVALLRRLQARPRAPRSRRWVAVTIALAVAAMLVLALSGLGDLLDPAERAVHHEEAALGLAGARDGEAHSVSPATPPARARELSSAGSPTTSAPMPPQRRAAPRPQRIEDEVAPPPSTNAVLEEARRLARAQAALRDGDPRRALALLDALARDVRGGAMAIEREALRAIAACEAGEARSARIDAVLAAPEAASYAARIRRACAIP